MERPTMLELSEAAIGKTWTAELHAALVRHIAEIERCYQEIIRRRQAAVAPSVLRQVEELVAACRDAQEAHEAGVRAFPWSDPLNDYDAARSALGRAWPLVAVVLEAVKRQGTGAAPESRP